MERSRDLLLLISTTSSVASLSRFSHDEDIDDRAFKNTIIAIQSLGLPLADKLPC